MRKTIQISMLFFALVAINVPAFAGLVSVSTAQTTAVNFYTLSATNLSGRNAVTATLKLTKTEDDGTVDFYVFDMSPGKGFVVVAADDQVKPVIAYSLESNFNGNTSNRGVKDWMEHAAAHIYKAVKQHTVANAQISNQWTSYRQGTRPASAKSLGSGVAPLLTTTWDQEPFYNKLCPFNTTDNQRALTGCAATAMAQIMKFWNYPAQGTGTYQYNDGPPTCTHNYGSQRADFGNTTYNWAAMPNSIDTDNIYIATLMYHCGVAVTMNYGDDNQGGSGSYVLASQTASWKHSAQMAYFTYFGYNPNTINGVYEANYSSADWITLLETELNAGRPIQYLGVDTVDGGHTWVCDGYDANDMMHMNWGWSGLDNGYYSVSTLTADGYNFSSNEAALIGIQPMSNLTVRASTSNSTICNGLSATLTAQGPANATYTWTPATGLSCSTCASTSASPTSSTTYTVTIDSAGLSATAQVIVSVVANHVNISMVNITNASTFGANDGTANVNVSGGTLPYSYVWNNEATGATASNLKAGSYSVTISDSHGCTASAIANVSQPDSGVTTGSHNSSSSDTSNQSGATTTPVISHRELSSSTRTATLWNQGESIYVQQSALVEVQGNFINQSGASASNVYNDGIMEISGDFENDSGAVFTTGTNSNSTDRAVKFMGSGKQVISGVMSGSTQSGFYNLVIDKASASDTVEMQTPVAVQGSIVFGTASTTSTYNPSSLYTNNNKKGVFKTFNDTKDY